MQSSCRTHGIVGLEWPSKHIRRQAHKHQTSTKLLLWEEGISFCRSQVGPFVVTFRRLLCGLASIHGNEHTNTKLQKIFNYVHCSATPQREAAPATKATQGKSQVPDRGTDLWSAGFPPPPPIKWTVPPPPVIKMDSGAAEQWLGRIVVNLNRYIVVIALASACASAWMHQHCAEVFWVVQLVQQSCYRQSIAAVHPPFGGN